MTVATRSPTECTGLEYTKKYVKQMLKNSMFIGSFQEKRLVDQLGAYRDIVRVSPEEEDFIKNLQAVKRKLDVEILTKTWVGITSPQMIGAPVGYNLWVILNEEVFGMYWYRVKTVEFLQTEIRLKLEVVRSYKRDSTPVRSCEENDENVSTIIEEKKKQFKENILYFLRHILTWENIKHTIVFLCVLISTILAGLFSTVQYLLDYLLKFLKELSRLINAVNPIAINIINLVGRSIFGLYQLIYALWQGKSKPAPVYNNYINFDPQAGFSDPRERYNKYFNQRALPYPSHRTRPIITPLDD